MHVSGGGEVFDFLAPSRSCLMSVAQKVGTLLLAVARAGGTVRLKRLAAAVMAVMLAASLACSRWHEWLQRAVERR